MSCDMMWSVVSYWRLGALHGWRVCSRWRGERRAYIRETALSELREGILVRVVYLFICFFIPPRGFLFVGGDNIYILAAYI